MAAKSAARFISQSEHPIRWKQAFDDNRLDDPSWYLIGLDRKEKLFLDTASMLGTDLRFGELIRLAFVMRAARAVFGETNSRRLQLAFQQLATAGILERCGRDFRLTRRADHMGVKSRSTGTDDAGEIVPPRLRAVIDRYGSRCVYCHTRLKPKFLTVDHVWPKCLGGRDSNGNKVPACKHCNLAKGGRSPEQWARDILRWNRPRRTKPRPLAMSYLAVVPAFVLSWLFSILPFLKGGVK